MTIVVEWDLKLEDHHQTSDSVFGGPKPTCRGLSLSNPLQALLFCGSTAQPHYNAPHHNAVFNITRSRHCSQNDDFVHKFIITWFHL